MTRFLLLLCLILYVATGSSSSSSSSYEKEKNQDIIVYPINKVDMTWGDFLSIKLWHPNSDNHQQKQQSLASKPKYLNSVSNLKMCGLDILTNITKKLSTSDIKWCQWALNPKGGNVIIGHSYGKLIPFEIERFEYLDCQAVAFGLDLSCDDMWGDGFLQSWKRNKVNEKLCEDTGANSKITCQDSPYPTSRFCIFENAMMNFKRSRIMTRNDGNPYRAFEKGFLSADCGYTAKDNIGYLQIYKPDIDGSTDAICDFMFNETVLVYSHDNIKNLGHSMISDFLNVWTMMWLSGNSRKSKDITLLNLDGIFKSTHYNHDKTNQYFRTYEKNFNRIIRANQFDTDSTVCFKKLIMQPKPSIPFAKNGWLHDTRCSLTGPSSLFQRWNLQVRNSYGLLTSTQDSIKSDSTSSSSSSSSSITTQNELPMRSKSSAISRGHSTDPFPITLTRDFKVLLILRSQHRGRHNSGGSSSGGTGNRTDNIMNMKETSRNFANQGEIIQALKVFSEASTNIDFVYFDLNKMSFESQIRLMSNMSIVIGMHGAGIASSVHMPVGGPNCCGVVEVFPHFSEFIPIHGYANMARQMGHHYKRLELGDSSYIQSGSSTNSGSGGGGGSVVVKKSGSIVQPSVLIEAIQYMIKAIQSKPSCFLPSVLKSPL